MADDIKKGEGKKAEKAPKAEKAEKAAVETPAAEKAEPEKAATEKAATEKAAGGKPAKGGGAPPKGEKAGEKAAKGGKPEKGDKGDGAKKGEKAAKGGKAAAAERPPVDESKPARLKLQYEDKIKKALIEAFNYANPLQVPRLEKIVLNMGVGEGAADRKKVEQAAEDLALIAGQKAVVTKAKKSIAGFKLREGMPIGTMVTLRRDRMYDFLDKLFNASLARVRDFRGIKGKIFDGRGNCSIGVKEFIVFPEIDYDKVDRMKGLNITIVTTAKTDNESRFMLKQLGMPFRN